MREIARTAHWEVSLDRARGIVRAKRTPVPYETIDELDASMHALADHVRTVDPASLGLLLDLRDGPFRNDDAFERAMHRHRGHLLDAFRSVAVLVSTAVGRLQTARIAREEGSARPIFMDEAEAIASLAPRARARSA